MNAPRYATATEIRDALNARGLRPRHRLGQNFMADPNMAAFVANAAELSRDDVALEIGAGTGALTRLLCERAGAVVAVEIDTTLLPLAQESCADCANAVFVSGDALEGSHLAPGVTEAVAKATAGGRTLKLVANLPYGAATAIMQAMLTRGPRPALMVLTAQSEVVDRMTAQPGSRDFGFLSLAVQMNGTVERLRTLKPEVFWPRPEVNSAVARVRVSASPMTGAEAALRVASGLLEHRRKTLARALRTCGLASSAEDADTLLRGAGLDPLRRPDTLGLDEFIRLAARIGKETP